MRLFMALIFSLSVFSAQASEPVPRHGPVIKKVKLLRSNPHRFTAINFAGVNPWDAVDDEDILPQRRHRFRFDQPDDTELSDYVQFRLWLARKLAIRKYLKTHHNLV